MPRVFGRGSRSQPAALVSDRDDAALFPAIRIFERYGSAKSGRAQVGPAPLRPCAPPIDMISSAGGLSHLPSGKVGHDIRGEKFTGLSVVPIAIDQQVDAGAAVLSDHGRYAICLSMLTLGLIIGPRRIRLGVRDHVPLASQPCSSVSGSRAVGAPICLLSEAVRLPRPCAISTRAMLLMFPAAQSRARSRLQASPNSIRKLNPPRCTSSSTSCIVRLGPRYA